MNKALKLVRSLNASNDLNYKLQNLVDFNMKTVVNIIALYI